MCSRLSANRRRHKHRRERSVKHQSRVGDIAVNETGASVKVVDREVTLHQWHQ